MAVSQGRRLISHRRCGLLKHHLSRKSTDAGMQMVFIACPALLENLEPEEQLSIDQKVPIDSVGAY
jgi:hypothetical protein